MRFAVTLIALSALFSSSASAELTPQAIVEKVLEVDVWGMKGVDLQGTAILKGKDNRTRVLTFESISLLYKKGLSKSLVRFRAPPELAGASFLQIQNDDRDDDRFIYLPELKRSRRVAAGQRSSAFMGTDFNFADLDHRDFRRGRPSAGPDVKLGRFDCYHLIVVPGREDSPYSKLELDVRKDIFVSLKIKMFDKAGVHYKTLTVQQLRRISGRWFITKALMENHKDQHSTVLMLANIKIPQQIDAHIFTQKHLEK